MSYVCFNLKGENLPMAPKKPGRMNLFGEDV